MEYVGFQSAAALPNRVNEFLTAVYGTLGFFKGRFVQHMRLCHREYIRTENSSPSPLLCRETGRCRFLCFVMRLCRRHRCSFRGHPLCVGMEGPGVFLSGRRCLAGPRHARGLPCLARGRSQGSAPGAGLSRSVSGTPPQKTES